MARVQLNEEIRKVFGSFKLGKSIQYGVLSMICLFYLFLLFRLASQLA